MSRRRRSLPREPVSAHIDSLSHEGRGVARIDGKAVFVQGALPGEDVLCRYTRKHARYSEALVLEVRTPSPQRVTPICAHADICGGCSLQHLSADDQIAHKQAVMLEQLHHIGQIEAETVFEPLRGPERGYRLKARLGVKYVEKKGSVLVGFREKASPYLADIHACEVLHPSVGRRIDALRELIGSLEARARIPQIEVAIDAVHTVLSFRHMEPLSPVDMEALSAFGRLHGIGIYLQPGGPDSVHPLWPEAGMALSYSLPDSEVSFAFRADDFIQVNADINRQMVARVLELLDPQPTEQVLDLFCGLGNFTLPLARRAGQVTGIEGDTALVQRARDNAAGNQIGNARFERADLAVPEQLAAFMSQGFDKLLLDPPRSGAAEIIAQLDYTGIKRIVYVSCNPATLARDAGVLVHNQGYRLLGAGVMDMFPHTAHVESIALFER